MQLTAKHVKVLCGRRTVHNLHVVLAAQLQKALHARAGMFRALAFITVRQQQNQAARLAPLGLGGGNELVDHDLSAVDEIAKLRLPHHERQRVCNAVTKLEAHHGVLAQQTIEDIEARLLRRDVPHGYVHFAGFVIVEFQMPLAEGTAPAILAAEPYRYSLENETTKRQGFTGRPVDRRAVQNLFALLEKALQLRMNL